MHIHILGICGTFMTGIATLARSLGHEVTGSDTNFYPPMSNYLENMNIEVEEIDYSEISKLGGLFRCTTLPLLRKKN